MANPEKIVGLENTNWQKPETKPEPEDFNSINIPAETDIPSRLNERQAAHEKILDLDRQIKETADENIKAALNAKRQQYVSRVMEINADFAAQGLDVPPLIDREKHGYPVREEMIIESKGQLEQALEQDQQAQNPKTEVQPVIPDQMLVLQNPEVAAELGLDARGLDEIAKKYGQMMEMANDDPIMREIFNSHITFTWDDFIKPSEPPKGFLGKLKALLANPGDKRQAMLEKIMDAYSQMIASGQVGVKGAAAQRLSEAKTAMKEPPTPQAFMDKKMD